MPTRPPPPSPALVATRLLDLWNMGPDPLEHHTRLSMDFMATLLSEYTDFAVSGKIIARTLDKARVRRHYHAGWLGSPTWLAPATGARLESVAMQQPPTPTAPPPTTQPALPLIRI